MLFPSALTWCSVYCAFNSPLKCIRPLILFPLVLKDILSNNGNSKQVMSIINRARSVGYEISSNILQGAVLLALRHMAFHGHQPTYESWNIMEYCWKLWDHEKLSIARLGEWYKLARNWSHILLQKWNQTALACFSAYETTNHGDYSSTRTHFFLISATLLTVWRNIFSVTGWVLIGQWMQRNQKWGRVITLESQHEIQKQMYFSPSPSHDLLPRKGSGTHRQMEQKYLLIVLL